MTYADGFRLGVGVAIVNLALFIFVYMIIAMFALAGVMLK